MLRPPKTFLVYSTVGMELVLSVLVGLFGGRWIDQKLHTGGLITILGFALGTVAGFRSLWRAAQRMEREALRSDPPDPPTTPPSIT